MLIIRENRLIAAILGGLIVIALLVLIFNDDPAPPTFPAADRTPAAGGLFGTSTPRATTEEFARPNIETLDCKTLLSSDAISAALGDPSSWSQVSRGETCLSEAGTAYLQITPGHPPDFAPGTQIFNVTGRPVAGIGASALWFGGPNAEGGGTVGVLVVATESNLGALIFRIAVGRPDLSPDQQLQVAKTAALAALPRFPGVAVAPPEPPRADAELRQAFQEPPPPDRSGVSYVDNLLAREADGEWTRGEGLRETLRFLAGDATSGEVLRQPDVVQREGTGIIRMAADYLQSDNADAALSADITQLLEAYTYTNDELERMAGITPAISRAPATQLITFSAAQQPVELCGNFFHGNISPGVGTCLEWRPANVAPGLPEGKYRVFIPSPDLPQAGWTEDDYDLALGALEFSARWFEEHGQSPAVNLVFSVSAGAPALAEANPIAGETCGVVVYPALQAESTSAFQQVVAHELAHCFQTETFTSKDFDYAVTKWREEGLAEYLSNAVYPQNNFEWEVVGEWGKVSRTANTVLDQSYANALFFQFLESKIGLEGIFSLVRALPNGGGRTQQEERLAGFANMKTLYQQFAEAMIDGAIQDTGGGLVPFEMLYSDHPLEGPATLDLEFERFGIGRIRFTVESCKQAHFSFNPDPISESARPQDDDGWGNLPDILGGGDEPDDRVFVISSIEPAKVTLDVTRVADDPECDEESSRPETPGPPCGLCPGTSFYWDWKVVTIN